MATASSRRIGWAQRERFLARFLLLRGSKNSTRQEITSASTDLVPRTVWPDSNAYPHANTT